MFIRKLIDFYWRCNRYINWLLYPLANPFMAGGLWSCELHQLVCRYKEDFDLKNATLFDYERVSTLDAKNLYHKFDTLQYTQPHIAVYEVRWTEQKELKLFYVGEYEDWPD